MSENNSNSNKRHTHADVIHAYAEGAEIEVFDEVFNKWKRVLNPGFYPTKKYRIKPDKKPWYKNIPEHGILCWVGDAAHEKFIEVIAGITEDAKFIALNGELWSMAVPLTNEEIMKFIRAEEG